MLPALGLSVARWGTRNMPHAEVDAVVLRHAFVNSAKAAPEAMTAIAKAPGAVHSTGWLAVYELYVMLGIKTALRERGMTADDIVPTCEFSIKSQDPHPLGRVSELRSGHCWKPHTKDALLGDSEPLGLMKLSR